jgi:hypothetical protein
MNTVKCSSERECLNKRDRALKSQNLNELHLLSDLCQKCVLAQESKSVAAITRRIIITEFQRAIFS